jgi:putative Mg2+ transporter-C (MgtC) family protein
VDIIGNRAEWQMLANVVLAMLLGGVIGFEREVSDKPAGFRTHMLVAGAAALLVALAFTLVELAVASPAGGAVTADPIRILQAIVIGVSFLGAGTIIRGNRPRDVMGLTTAASLLMSSGIGVAVAVGTYVLAIGLTLLVTAVLWLIGRVERRLHQWPDEPADR